MTRSLLSVLLLGTLLALASSCTAESWQGARAMAASAPASDQLPNLVFILTDEQRYDTSAPYGNDQIQTPSLNRLGREGVVFERAYVSQPLCSPSRSSILTGLYPHTTGVTSNNIPLADSLRTLPELLPETYHTAYIGKWHLGRELDAWQGFETRISTEDYYTLGDTTRFSDYRDYLASKGYAPDWGDTGAFTRTFSASLPYEESKANFIKTHALRFLEAHQNKPFALYLSFLEPHSPNTGPFDDLHDRSEIDLDSTYAMAVPEGAPLRHVLQKESGYTAGETPTEKIARYWGRVHEVDRAVGAVLDRIDALGLAESTVVVFTSEHGKMIGQHGLEAKNLMLDPSARVPWMARAPGLSARHVEARVSHIDLVPTVLDLMGQPVPARLQGESLVPLMKGERAASEADLVFIEDLAPPADKQVAPYVKDLCLERASRADCEAALRQNVRTVVTQDGWKLIWSDTDTSLLFNLDEDPNELNNLYDDPTQQDRVQRLRGLIRDWQACTHDTTAMER